MEFSKTNLDFTRKEKGRDRSGARYLPSKEWPVGGDASMSPKEQNQNGL